MDQRLTAVEEALCLLNAVEFGGLIYTSNNYYFSEPDSPQKLRIFQCA